MSHIDQRDDDWETLMAAWQSQAAAQPDLQALQHEVSRRSRRLRVLRIGELLMAALSLGNCLRAWLLGSSSPIPSTVLLGLMGLVIGYTVWVQWQRRRQWRARDLDPHALIAFEVTRTLTSIRIWRVSTWSAMALWVALTIWGIVALRVGPVPGGLPGDGWALNILLNAVVVLVSAGLGFGMGQRRRRRLARLDALRCALDSE
jgi:hypothetical protein